MLTLNIERLIDILQRHQMALYDIWTECRNVELSEEIERQREKIVRLIQSLEILEEEFFCQR